MGYIAGTGHTMTSEANVAVRTNGYTSLEDSSENDEQVELFDESEKTVPEYFQKRSCCLISFLFASIYISSSIPSRIS